MIERYLVSDKRVNGIDILRPFTRRIRHDTHDRFFNLFVSGKKWNGVAIAFTHFSPVRARHCSYLFKNQGLRSLRVSPNVRLNFCAVSRAYSTCCFWSCPTGTTFASCIKISAAISMGELKVPTLTSRLLA